MVGEQSNYLHDTSNNYYPCVPGQLGNNCTYLSQGGHGWIIGSPNATTPPPSWTPVGDPRCFNCTTVAYSINQAAYGLSGTDSNVGNNMPFVSAHPGGANFLFADGSVQFLSDATTLTVLQRLASKDDGVVVTW